MSTAYSTYENDWKCAHYFREKKVNVIKLPQRLTCVWKDNIKVDLKYFLFNFLDWIPLVHIKID